MEISKVTAVYFSPTGNAKKVITCIAKTIAEQFGAQYGEIDYTLPAAREAVYSFTDKDLVVFGTPVYAGRIPNKTLPYVQSHFEGNGALALPVAVYGNRSFDNGLIELRIELENHGFHAVAGAGIVTEHVFSDKLATGRPNADDMAEITAFAQKAADKIKALASADGVSVEVPGENPVGPYYVPKGTDGKPAVFLKAKVQTKPDVCVACGRCVKVCPMGSISADDPKVISGICIKCQACVKTCPLHAKYFDDAAFLSHVAMLEQNFTARKENQFFL